MDKLAIILAIAALGGVAWFATNQQGAGSNAELTEQVTQLQGLTEELQSRLDKLDQGRAPAMLSGDQPDRLPGGRSGAAGPFSFSLLQYRAR